MPTYAAPLLVLGVMAGVAGLPYAAHRMLAIQREPAFGPPYLGGMRPAEHAFSRFHPRWYLISLVFLAFDMEMLFMYPWTLVVRALGTSTIVEMFTVLALLVVAAMYAAREGAFRWV